MLIQAMKSKSVAKINAIITFPTSVKIHFVCFTVTTVFLSAGSSRRRLFPRFPPPRLSLATSRVAGLGGGFSAAQPRRPAGCLRGRGALSLSPWRFSLSLSLAGGVRCAGRPRVLLRTWFLSDACGLAVPCVPVLAGEEGESNGSSSSSISSILVDPASSHMLVSKIKPCMSKFTPSYGETANGSLNQSRFLR